jgi:hypothetical protein
MSNERKLMKDQTHLMSQPKGDDTWMSKTGGFARDMTLRDEFAGLAMQGKIANGSTSAELISEIAYEMADAMLKAREAK